MITFVPNRNLAAMASAENQLTEKEFWTNYWDAKRDEIIVEVPVNDPLNQKMDEIIGQKQINSAVELGGFPGTYSIYLKKKHNLDTTVLDYFIEPGLFKDLMSKNNLKESDISLVEMDLLSKEMLVSKRYDLVFSLGLIEHFKDTANIIEKHLQFINQGKELLIIIPNFRGINGWVQKMFDMENYKVHNIECMDPAYLKKVSEELGLVDVESYYYGKFSTWLENKKELSLLKRFAFKVVWVFGKVLNLAFTKPGKNLSSYIVLRGTKQ